jgi:ArsR family transcriptional regulator
MSEKEFFELISNETRRNILRSIAQEPKYLFQLSQELNKSQQSLQRHLQCLLEKGWLVQEMVEGPKGPTRKMYHIAKNISVRITLSQHSLDFDVFEISIGESESEHSVQHDHVEFLSKDLPNSISKALEDTNSNFEEKIRNLDKMLDRIGIIESFLLSRKLSITGELNETISMKLEGDAHRKDRELAYTIYSSSSPISLDLVQKEIKTKRSELLASLKRLRDKDLLPEHGVNLMKKLESTLKVNSK